MPSLSLSDRNEAMLLSLLDANLSLSFLIRHHKMTLDQALAWWRQPHIKRALAELTDLSQARARAIAANDATNAVTALQSCLVLSDTEFYEQADPKTRLRAFESARKAATQVLRLAGLSCAIPRGIAFPGDAAAHPDSASDPARSPRSKVQPVSPRAITFPSDAAAHTNSASDPPRSPRSKAQPASDCAITRGCERVMLRDVPPPGPSRDQSSERADLSANSPEMHKCVLVLGDMEGN